MRVGDGPGKLGKNWVADGSSPIPWSSCFLLSSSGLIGSRFEHVRTGISGCLSEMETSNEQRTN